MTSRSKTTATPRGVAEEIESLPEVEAIRRGCREPAYLVGGAVRDLLLGRELSDLDFAIDGAVEEVARSLGGAVTEHSRFGTASVHREGRRTVDLARTRTEVYEEPGALPRVEPASIEEDLGRRDFTINAMAIPLSDTSRLIDPFSARDDLKSRTIRTLHAASFRDDPTRALRAARYAARFGFDLAPETRDQLDSVDLSSVSRQRLTSEIFLCAREECETGALSRAVEWGVLGAPSGLLDRICALFDEGDWAGYAQTVGIGPEEVMVAAVTVEGELSASVEAAQSLSDADPASDGEILELIEGHTPEEIILARGMGTGWLDRWVGRLRLVSLDISGRDLIASGASPGRAVGAALGAALLAKLEDPQMDRSGQLEIALAKYRKVSGPRGGD